MSFFKGMCLLLLVLVATPTGLSNAGTEASNPSILDSYRQQSLYTEPGKYAYLYEELPKSLEDLCALIKQQLMHPFDQGSLRKTLPKDRRFEDVKYRDVSGMLAGLLELDPDGLVSNREAADRLMVGCWHHAMLLSSILRHRGTPVRLRCGYAPYLAPGSGLHVGHVICEVWDSDVGDWILVDPDRQKVDFSKSEFEFASIAWLAMRSQAFDPKEYRAAHLLGVPAALLILHMDHRSIVCSESPYWDPPAIVNEDPADWAGIGDERLTVLDRIATLLGDPDEHIAELRCILENHEYFRNEERTDEQ